MAVIKVSQTIGLPPSTYVSDNMVRNSIPIAEIRPCQPSFKLGMSIFELNETDGWNRYIKILNSHGFTIDPPIKLAFLADNFPTDSFTNEYGESFLQKFTDVASGGAAAISQFFGVRSADVALERITKGLKERPGVLGMIGGGFEEAQKQVGKLKESLIAGMGPGGGAAVEKMGGVFKSVLTGARVDFPQVWKNSGFAPSYTMTIRLYNPTPSSHTSTKQHIIGPLAALALLGIPISEEGDTYNWPFLHKISCPGIYNLDPAFISNITVVKGGDQQQIAHNQRLGIVDIRIDFGSLYNSILAEEGKNISNRPTLRTYLKALEGGKKTTDVYAAPAGASASSSQRIKLLESPYTVITPSGRVSLIQNPHTARRGQEASSFETDSGSRVSAREITLANNLEDQMDEQTPGFG